MEEFSGARALRGEAVTEEGLTEEEQLLEDMDTPPASSSVTSRLFMRRFVQPLAVLAVAAMLGYAGYAVHFQTRLRPPVAPIPMTDSDLAETHSLGAATELTVEIPLVGPWCSGSAIHLRPPVRCALDGVCCRNDGGSAYCCAAGNDCYKQVCVAGPGQCFPGEAEIALADGSKKRIDELKTGEHVLVETFAEGQRFEPVLAFLHQLPGPHESLTVEHALGTFRASANHLVFVQDAQGKRVDKIAVQLKAGDLIYLPSTAAQTERSVEVISVHSSKVDSGMYAPLTASGTIIVDGIVASNYASQSQAAWIPHAAIHAAFLPVRAYHLFALGVQGMSNIEEGSDEMHPYADVLQRYVSGPALRVLGQYK